MKKTVMTMTAQKIGFWKRLLAPSCGMRRGAVDQAGELLDSGVALVIRLTTTVTRTQTIQHHRAR